MSHRSINELHYAARLVLLRLKERPPLHTTEQKCKELKEKLEQEVKRIATELADSQDSAPF